MTCNLKRLDIEQKGWKSGTQGYYVGKYWVLLTTLGVTDYFKMAWKSKAFGCRVK